MDKNTYKRFTQNKYSRYEYFSVRKAFFNEKDQENLDHFMREDWKDITAEDFQNTIDLRHVLHKIHYTINKTNKKKKAPKIQKAWDAYIRIAAILLIPLFITTLYYFFNDRSDKNVDLVETYTEIHAPIGSRTKFQLPDGSVGWLNSGSALTYSNDFLNNRQVKLTGEAYFDVRHIDNSSFEVGFSNLIVNVLGTKFNVQSYSEENITEVVLEKGQVEILNENKKLVSRLAPDQKFALNKLSKSATLENVDAQKYTAWRNGKIIFRNEPLPEVVKRLGRWYNTDFVLEDEELNTIRYRATFSSDEPLEEILRLLSLSAPIRYEIKKREKNEHNEFFKKKVVLKVDTNQ